MPWELDYDTSVPPLPEPLVPGAPGRGKAKAKQLFLVSRLLPPGGYVMRLTPAFSVEAPIQGSLCYSGTLRVQWIGERVMGSGDLYLERNEAGAPAALAPDEHEPTGIPIRDRKAYRYHVRLTSARGVADSGLELGLELYSYDPRLGEFSAEGGLVARLSQRAASWGDFPAPSGSPGAVYHQGGLTNRLGTAIGELEFGWISPWLRRAVLEIDRLPSSLAIPGGADISQARRSWRRLFAPVGLYLEVRETVPRKASVTPRGGPKGAIAWKEEDLHAKMLERRGTVDLDREWIYYLVCIETFARNEHMFGKMFDLDDYDTNGDPREGLAIAAHGTFRDKSSLGKVAGRRLEDVPEAYLRTAIHEMAHALHLIHSPSTPGFTQETQLLTAAPGQFPDNIPWFFAPRDALRLAHAPDPWLRPGGLPWRWRSADSTVAERDVAVAPAGVALTVRSLASPLPLGAPLRLELELTGHATATQPPGMSLKSGNVRVVVKGPSGELNPVTPVLLRLDEASIAPKPSTEVLPPNHSLVLLTGDRGPLLPMPGSYEVRVELFWRCVDDDEVSYYYRLEATCAVRVGACSFEQIDLAGVAFDQAAALVRTIALFREASRSLAPLLADRVLGPHYRAIASRQRLESALATGDRAAATDAFAGLKGAITTGAERTDFRDLFTLLGEPGGDATRALLDHLEGGAHTP